MVDGFCNINFFLIYVSVLEEGRIPILEEETSHFVVEGSPYHTRKKHDKIGGEE